MASILLDVPPESTLFVSHLGGDLAQTSDLVLQFLQHSYRFHKVVTFRNPHAVRPGDVVSMMLTSGPMAKAVASGIPSDTYVVIWNPEQIGSPRFNAIVQELEAQLVSVRPNHPWIMVTLSEYSHDELCVVRCQFTYDVPREPPATEVGPAHKAICVHVPTGRRKTNTSTLVSRLASVPIPGLTFECVEGVPKRDHALAKSGIVINMHARPLWDGFEMHRVSRALAFGCMVLSEHTTDHHSVNLLKPFGLIVCDERKEPMEFAHWLHDRLQELAGSGMLTMEARRARQNAFYQWYRTYPIIRLE